LDLELKEGDFLHDGRQWRTDIVGAFSIDCRNGRKWKSWRTDIVGASSIDYRHLAVTVDIVWEDASNELPT
jgi:hypothetical protein